jgi:outer membrane murein-binding lipoprotein Lpp
MKWKILIIFILSFGFSSQLFAQENSELASLEEKIQQLQYRVQTLNNEQSKTKEEVNELKEAIKGNALALIFFAVFCAWWAKTTGRSSLLWFILGMFFHVFTAIAVLIKTERGT